eukprot:CAMPEP_0196578980 /NCGR_PEP_ID=MMETSP1081-20130531/15112_1 /TAXON_ID=36882 /ORGANISM="Pyramimonas amylifera, Strain CCMP720" /LENGTH=178 /DNA_ID=CAMNT_0041898397 /DNA_START=48 /DNA_END=584 /DNA_ORIENTATION=+
MSAIGSFTGCTHANRYAYSNLAANSSTFQCGATVPIARATLNPRRSVSSRELSVKVKAEIPVFLSVCVAAGGALAYNIFSSTSQTNERKAFLESKGIDMTGISRFNTVLELVEMAEAGKLEKARETAALQISRRALTWNEKRNVGKWIDYYAERGVDVSPDYQQSQNERKIREYIDTL